MPNHHCVFACQTHSHAKAQRRKENEDTGITTVLAGRGWAIPLSSSPHAVCPHKSGTVRAVRWRMTFASLRLCVTNTSSRQGAEAQRKRGCWYNDGAGGAIGYCLPALRAELPACQSRWRKKGAGLFLRGPILRGPILRVPGHRKRETVRAGRSRKRAGLISSPQPIIKTSGHHMSPLQGFVCFRA